MPNYLFENERNGLIIEVFQSMSQEHRYIDEDGYEWRRLYSIPQMSVDTQFDPMNPRDFVEKTGKKKGNLGNVFDQSRELSEKREKLIGKDTVKEQYQADWSKKRGGRKFFDTAANKPS